MTIDKTIGYENVPKTAVRYRFSKKLNCWVRTWFTVEQEKNEPMFFKQHNAFSSDKNKDWDKWATKPV